jgi:hypothetical protein
MDDATEKFGRENKTSAASNKLINYEPLIIATCFEENPSDPPATVFEREVPRKARHGCQFCHRVTPMDYDAKLEFGRK